MTTLTTGILANAASLQTALEAQGVSGVTVESAPTVSCNAPSRTHLASPSSSLIISGATLHGNYAQVASGASGGLSTTVLIIIIAVFVVVVVAVLAAVIMVMRGKKSKPKTANAAV